MFSNWSKSSYNIFYIGLVVISVIGLAVNSITLGTVISIIGTLFGFLSVILIVNKKKQAGYVGMVSALIYMFISWQLGNYSDTLLNILFIVFLNLPLILNKNYQKNGKPRTIKGNSALKIELFLFWVVIYASLYMAEVHVFNAPRPFWSVLAASLGIVASVSTSVLMLKESFWLWSIQNVLQVVLFGITLYQTHSGIALLMMTTYIFYTINASTAFFNGKWYVNELKEKRIEK